MKSKRPQRHREHREKRPKLRKSAEASVSSVSLWQSLPLYSYQQRWLDDQSRFKLWVKSVQIGASFAQCLEAVLDCAQGARKNSALWILLSASERQALELARTARRICQAGGIAAELRENEFFEQTLTTQHSIEFPNGARILALPANPDTARGYAGNVVLDEFAIHRDAREIWRAAFGRASRGYKIRVLSSPKGQSGKFFELAKELGLAGGHAPADRPVPGQNVGPGFRPGRAGMKPAPTNGLLPSSIWSGHWTDIHTAVREGCPLKIDELRAAAGDEDTWLQEYCCVFLGDAQNFIPLELIASCESPEATLDFEVPSSKFQVPSVRQPGTWNLEPGTFFFGMDVGRKHDLSVLVIIEKLGDVCWVRRIQELARASFSLQEQAIADACALCLRGCLDATGIGLQMAERMKERFGGRIEPVEFTLQVKQDLAVRAKRMFEERRIRIPDHPALRRDIGAVKRLITPAGNVRFDADRTEAGHADRFWALALALAAADSGVAAASLGVDPGAEFGVRNAEFAASFGLWQPGFGARRTFFQATA